MKTINIYKLSRINFEAPFNIIHNHSSHSYSGSKNKIHEILSLNRLVDELFSLGVTINELDGFNFSYNIPRIGKEFDLLKITESTCLNIELKSKEVPKEQILDQLLKNRHYLNHLEKRLLLYSVVTDSMTVYKLGLNDDLVEIDISEIAESIKSLDSYIDDIDELFSASKYLISPFTSPDKFINQEYFLTQAQDLIKRELLSAIDKGKAPSYYHITGSPGTGKTLLVYDIAKTLSKSGKVLVLNSFKLLKTQEKISNDIRNFEIIDNSTLKDTDLSKFSFILVDEAHRLSKEEFKYILDQGKKFKIFLIFSSDPDQILTSLEKKNNIVGKIRKLENVKEFILSEKIRSNKDISSFLYCIMDKKRIPKRKREYKDIEIAYANTIDEAKVILKQFKEREYVFINYTKSCDEHDPYLDFEIDFDVHQVIGQEFDKVVMLMDKSFYYDEKGKLKGVPKLNPDFIYPNLFYQGITRVREKLALIILDSPKLLEDISKIIERE